MYGDYAMPLVIRYLAGWLGIEPADVTYAVDDQLAAGDLFDSWPPLATPEMDDYYRSLMARPQLGGVAAAARELVGSGVITERESWGIVYSIAVSAVATATTITLAIGGGATALMPLVIGLLAAFVVYGRTRLVPQDGSRVAALLPAN